MCSASLHLFIPAAVLQGNWIKDLIHILFITCFFDVINIYH